MYESFRCGHPSLTASPACDYLMVVLPDPLTVLAHMSEQRVLLLLQHCRNIYVGVREKSLRLAAAVYFEKINMRHSRQAHASANRQHAGHLMVHVRVDGPMSEDLLGLFGRKQFPPGFNVRPPQLPTASDRV